MKKAFELMTYAGRRVFPAIKSAMGTTPVPVWIRKAAFPKTVGILFYHKPDPELFGKHLAFIRKYYNPVSMDELARALDAGSPDMLPKYPVVIQIDDGYRENIDLLPHIIRHQVPVSIFLVTSAIGTRRKFWYEAVLEQGGDPDRYKRVQHADFLQTLKSEFDYTPEREYPTATALDWDQVRHMHNSGLVTFGAHTHTHPILPMCSDETARREIVESKTIIEQQLDSPCHHFSYPNGDGSEREQVLLKEAGFKTARGFRWGFISIDADCNPLDLATLRSPETASVPHVSLILAGWVGLMERVKGIVS